MAVMKQDIPNRVTVYHDNIDQEQELKNAMLQRNRATLTVLRLTKRTASKSLKAKSVR